MSVKIELKYKTEERTYSGYFITDYDKEVSLLQVLKDVLSGNWANLYESIMVNAVKLWVDSDQLLYFVLQDKDGIKGHFGEICPEDVVAMLSNIKIYTLDDLDEQ